MVAMGCDASGFSLPALFRFMVPPPFDLWWYNLEIRGVEVRSGARIYEPTTRIGEDLKWRLCD